MPITWFLVFDSLISAEMRRNVTFRLPQHITLKGNKEDTERSHSYPYISVFYTNLIDYRCGPNRYSTILLLSSNWSRGVGGRSLILLPVFGFISSVCALGSS